MKGDGGEASTGGPQPKEQKSTVSQKTSDIDWNYNQHRMEFISKMRGETKCSFATAKGKWDESDHKKRLLGPLSLAELKRRKFVPKDAESNPWA